MAKARTKKAKSETMWMGFSKKTGTVLPWIWSDGRASCTDRHCGWKPSEYTRRRVRIVPIKPTRTKARR